MSYFLSLLVYNPSTASYEDSDEALSITIENSEIVTDNYLVPPEVTYFGREQLYWRYEHPVYFSYGCLNFHDNWQYFHGMYVQGVSTNTASFHAVQGVANPCKYNTWISSSSTCPQRKGPSIVTGYEWDSRGVPKPVFQVSDNVLSENVWVHVISPSQYVIKISEEASDTWHWQEANFPLTAEFKMAKDSKSFVGTITFAPADNTKVQSNHCWNGNAVAMPINKPMLAEIQSTTELPLVDFDLFTLCNAPPQIQQVAQEMFTRVMKCVVHKSRPGWSKVLKDAVQSHSLTELTPSLQEIAQLPGTNTFYTNFAMSCIGISFYHSEKKEIYNITDEQYFKMSYYFIYLLPTDSSFIIQANAFYRQAFLSKRPRLKVYLDDQERRKNKGQDEFYWAKQLHKLILSPASISTFVSTLLHSEGDIYHQLRDYGTLLGLLQPSGELVLDAYRKLFIAVLATLSEKINLKGMKDKISVWIVKFVENLLEKQKYEESSPRHESAHKLRESSNAFKQAADISGTSINLANLIAHLIAVESTNIYNHSNDVADKVVNYFVERGLCEDLCHGLKRGVVAIVHLVALVTVLHAFLNLEPIKMEVTLKEVTKLGIEILFNLPNVTSDSETISKVIRRLFYTESVLGMLETLMKRMATQHQWDHLVASTIESGFIHCQDPFKGLFETLPQVFKLTAPTALLIATFSSIFNFMTATDSVVREKIFNDVRNFSNTLIAISLTAGLSLFELGSFAGPFATLGVVLRIVKFIYPLQRAAVFCNETALQKFIDELPQPPPDFATGSQAPQ